CLGVSGDNHSQQEGCAKQSAFVPALELQGKRGGIAGGLSFGAGQLPPRGRETGPIGQAVIKKDRELLRLEGVEGSVRILGPPANAALREPAGNQPISDSIVT